MPIWAVEERTTVARGWIHVIWACWTTNTPYDPAWHGGERAGTGLHPDADLACAAIKMAVATRGGREAIWLADEAKRVSFHTDLGSTGRFKWSSQHLDLEVLDGEKAAGCRSCAASEDAVSGQVGFPAAG